MLQCQQLLCILRRCSCRSLIGFIAARKAFPVYTAQSNLLRIVVCKLPEHISVVFLLTVCLSLLLIAMVVPNA